MQGLAVAGLVSGPPDNIPPDELFVALTKRPRPGKLVDLPINDALTGKSIGQVWMSPLTQEELLAAKAEATRLGKALTKDNLDPREYVVGHEQIFQELCGCEILYRACRRAAMQSVLFFPTPADVRKKLSGDEVAVLIQAYAIVQVELGPLISTMSTVEMDAWLKRLGEGASALPLAWLSLEQRTALLMHSASRLLTLPTGNGSAGPPADESTTSESAPTATP